MYALGPAVTHELTDLVSGCPPLAKILPGNVTVLGEVVVVSVLLVVPLNNSLDALVAVQSTREASSQTAVPACSSDRS